MHASLYAKNGRMHTNFSVQVVHYRMQLSPSQVLMPTQDQTLKSKNVILQQLSCSTNGT